MVQATNLDINKILSKKDRPQKSEKSDKFERVLNEKKKESKPRKEDAVSTKSEDKSIERNASKGASERTEGSRSSGKMAPVAETKGNNSENKKVDSQLMSVTDMLDSVQENELISEEMQNLIEQKMNALKEGTGKELNKNLQMQSVVGGDNQLINQFSNQNSNTDLDLDISSIGQEIQKLNSSLQNSSSDQMQNGDLSMSGSNLMESYANLTQKSDIDNGFNEVLVNKVNSMQGPESMKQENISNIVQQARSVIKDGGGEMQIQLMPEGLGKVDLKVDVQNGNVNVEIMAENKATKSLFENSMNDIKGALENQNLRVETVKVDVSGDLEKHFSEGQLDMMNRDFAQGFLGQFREERQFFRNQIAGEAFDDVPREESQPQGISPARSSIRNQGMGEKRLNIFA